MTRSRRKFRSVLNGWLALSILCSLGLASCKSFAPRRETLVSNARRLDAQNSVQVVMSKLPPRAKRVATDEEQIEVAIHFDPELLDVRETREVVLWGRVSNAATWKRLATAELQDMPLSVDLPEGTIGLRASAIKRDGSEEFVPRADDEPVTFLIVDRTPPQIQWLRPAPQSPVDAAAGIQFEWSVNEIEVGEALQELSWSYDDGAHWLSIAKVPPGTGHQTYSWRPPAALPTSILVRVTAYDLVGHPAEQIVPLQVLARGSEVPRSFTAPIRPDSENTTPPGAETARPQAVSHDATERAEPANSTLSVKDDTLTRPEITLLMPDSLLVGGGEAPGGAMFVAGGRSAEIGWKTREIPATETLIVEWRTSVAEEWSLVDRASVRRGSVLWQVPCADLIGCLIRVRASSGAANAVSKPFSIDCTPPHVSLAAVAPILPVRPVLDMSVDDGDGAGLRDVDIYLRRGQEGPWKLLPRGQRVMERAEEGYRLALDLSHVPEASYQMFVRAKDGVGNATPEPDAASVAFGQFMLDKTAPAIELKLSPFEWVEGMTTEIVFEADWTDVVMPVVLEGRRDVREERWETLARWTRVAPGQTQFSWTTPTGYRQCQVRVVVRDQAGNSTHRNSDIRRVLPAIQLESPAVRGIVRGQTVQNLRWRLHPAAEALEALTVQVEHQAGAAAQWTPICDRLAVNATCAWDVPPGTEPASEHRLRVRLLRRGELVSSHVCEPFSVVQGTTTPPPPTEARDATDSRALVESAHVHEARYWELVNSVDVSDKAERLRQEEATIRRAYKKAVEFDPSNVGAYRGLARFLSQLSDADAAVEAVKNFQKALDLSPNNVWAYNDLGVLFINLKQFTKAEEVFKRGLAVEAPSEVLFNLGLALQEQKKRREADHYFRKSLEKPNPRVPAGSVYYHLVLNHLHRGETAEAKALFQRQRQALNAQLREQIAAEIEKQEREAASAKSQTEQ